MRIASWEYIIARHGAPLLHQRCRQRASPARIIIHAEIIPRRANSCGISDAYSCRIILMATLLTLTHFASCFPRERAVREHPARAPVRVNYRSGTHLGIFLAPRQRCIPEGINVAEYSRSTFSADRVDRFHDRAGCGTAEERDGERKRRTQDVIKAWHRDDTEMSFISQGQILLLVLKRRTFVVSGERTLLPLMSAFGCSRQVPLC